MTTYTYSHSSDFGSSLNSSQLQTEIKASNIVPSIASVNRNGDVIDIVFASALSGAEQTTLNGLVSAHVPKPILDSSTYITPKKGDTSSKAYARMSIFKYYGSNNTAPIVAIETISCMSDTVTSYDIRILDKTNGLVIAEKTGLTHTDDAVDDLGTISNLPTDSALFEVQMKRNGGNGNPKVFLENIIIYT